jgi:hypothetical protein
MNTDYRQTISEMQHLTREYASFSQSRSGLGNVLGGVAGLLSFAIMWLLGAGVATAVLTVGLTFAWLAGKEIIRRQLYRPFGEARESWPAPQRRGHLHAAALIGLVCAAFLVIVVVRLVTATTPWSVALPYLIFCLITPWIAWRFLRTTNEFMVGLYLLFASAVVNAGFVPDRLWLVAILPWYSLVLVVLGLREHRQFQDLTSRLRGLREVTA